MHENEVSKTVIGSAIDVHRELGPGLIESVYEEALCHELHLRALDFLRQRSLPISYKDIKLATPLRLDLLVAGKVIVDVKSKDEILPIDKQKMRTYLKLADLHLGLIINFNVSRLIDGVVRVVHQLEELPPDLRAGPEA
ncbi:MAG: GxxExxY protein [Chthoniobacterales bacterium]